MIDSTDFEGKFEFRPLEPGYGLTIGNALRRVLLSALEGYAITSVRIEGVDHEFSSQVLSKMLPKLYLISSRYVLNVRLKI
jgi:DNA-directed RNA polymerase alpha subunit